MDEIILSFSRPCVKAVFHQHDVNIAKEIKDYLDIKDYLVYEAPMVYLEIWAQKDLLDLKEKRA